MKIVIVNCFDTYENRVKMLCKYFSNKKNETIVLTSDFQHIKKTYVEKMNDEYKYIHTKAYYKNISIARIISHYRFAKEAINVIKKMEPDLLWVLVPPNFLCYQVSKYKKKKNKTKIIFDFIDIWPETMPISKFRNNIFYTMWKNLRSKNMKYADVIVTECDYFKEALRETFDENKMNTMYLAREMDEYIPISDLKNDRIEICYLGSINNIIDIPLITEILKKIRYKVVFHIIGNGEKKDELVDSVKKAGALVVDHGELYQKDDKRMIFQKCHFGMNIMKKNVFVGLTMKSIDYLESGVPMINNIPGDTKKLIHDYGIGINVDESILNKPYIEIDSKFFENEVRKTARSVYETLFSTESCQRVLETIMTEVNENIA